MGKRKPLRQYTKHVAFPEVRLYNGDIKDYTFNTFLDMCTLNYQSDQRSSEELKAIIKVRLFGKARCWFEASSLIQKQGLFEIDIDRDRACCVQKKTTHEMYYSAVEAKQKL